MRATVVAAAVAFALGCGCGDDGASAPADAGNTDGGSGADAAPPIDLPAAPAAPEPPTLPERPLLTPCPSGWRVVDDEPQVCDPYPEGGPEECGAGEAHFPGEPGCAPAGRACPADGWPAGLPASGVVHARAGAAPGGDGSRAAPFGSIAEAFASAVPGSVVALAAGTFDEAIEIPEAVAVRGACAAETLIFPSTPDTDAAVLVTAPDVSIADVTITGAPGLRRGLHVVGASAAAHVDGLVVELSESGIAVLDGARLDGTGVVVRSTSGRGLGAWTGSRIELARVVVDHTGVIAVTAHGSPTVVRMTGAAIRRTDDGRLGVALAAGGGARLEVEAGLVELARYAGVIAGDTGTHVVLRDTVVRDTQWEAATDAFGRGVSVESSASVTLERVLVSGNREAGVAVLGATAQMTDVVVRDTLPAYGDGTLGRGIGLSGGATATMRRVAVVRSGSAGMSVIGLGTMLTAEDLLIHDTEGAGGDDDAGRGLEVGYGASVRIDRAMLSGNREAGVLVHGEETMATLADVSVSHTRPTAGTEEAGRGIEVRERAHADVTRAFLLSNREVGVLVRQAASAELSDIAVRNTSPRGSDGRLGDGLLVAEGSTVVVRRALLGRNHEAAVAAHGEGTRLELSDVTVQDTRPVIMGVEIGGIGLAAQDGADLRVTRALVERCTHAGVLADAATVVLEDTVVRETAALDPTGLFGRGLVAQRGARVEGTRLLFDRNHEAGLTAALAGTSVTLSEVTIRETLERPCADDVCRGAGAGIGAGVYGGGALELTRFVVADNALCGVQVARGALPDGSVGEAGEMDLRDGVVSGNPIGANVQDSSFDVARLSDRVSYVDNDVALDTSTLPVPDTATAP